MPEPPSFLSFPFLSLSFSQRMIEPTGRRKKGGEGRPPQHQLSKKGGSLAANIGNFLPHSAPSSPLSLSLSLLRQTAPAKARDPFSRCCLSPVTQLHPSFSLPSFLPPESRGGNCTVCVCVCKRSLTTSPPPPPPPTSKYLVFPSSLPSLLSRVEGLRLLSPPPSLSLSLSL